MRLFSGSQFAAAVDAACPAAQAWTRGCASTPCRCLGNSACRFPVVSLELAGHPVDSGAAESGCRAPARCPVRSADAPREPLPSGGDRKPRRRRCCQEHGPNALLAARAAPRAARRHSRLRRPGASCLPGRRRLISAQSTIRRPPCGRSRRTGRCGCRSTGATGARPEHRRRARGRRPTRSSSSCHTGGAISAFVSAKPRAATPRTRPPRSPSHHSRGADGTCRRARGFGCVRRSWAFPLAGRSSPRQCFALAGAECSATQSC
jgi:hypothetical protein